MFYKVAVIQNEKELLKYDHLDWKNKIKKLNIPNDDDINYDFRFYRFSYFDENNISNLFEKDLLLDYDCVCFTMNSLLKGISNPIYIQCKNNKDKIETFLKNGKGIFIGFSNKIECFDFLPDEYLFNQVYYNDPGENIEFSKKFLENAYIDVSKETFVSEYIERTKNHSTVKGIYMSSIDGFNNSHYKVLSKDSDRNLIIATKRNDKYRIVATTLPIDWQGQDVILYNIVKYCAEGLPTIKIFKKKNKKNKYNDYNINFLYQQLNLNKLAFSVSAICNMDEAVHSIEIYDNIIFDHNFTKQEIDNYCNINLTQLLRENTRVLHHEKAIKDNSSTSYLYNLIIHNTYQKINLLKTYTVSFLENAVNANNIDSKMGLIELYEAVRFLSKNGELTNERKCEILKPTLDKWAIKTKDGSFDHMFVPSCIIFAYYSMCYNDESFRVYLDKIKLLKKYIKEKLQSNTLTIFEKSHALYYLCLSIEEDNDFFEISKMKLIFEEILKHLKNENISNYTSYSTSNCIKASSEFLLKHIKTFIENDSCFINLFIEYMKVVEKICDSYDEYGSIDGLKSVSNIVVSLTNIIRIINLLENKKFKDKIDFKCVNKLKYFEEHYFHKLFALIGYLQFNIHNDTFVIEYDKNIDNTPKLGDIIEETYVMNALIGFYALNLYPIDEILLLLNFNNSDDSDLKMRNLLNNQIEIIKINDLRIKKKNERIIELEIEKKGLEEKNKTKEVECRTLNETILHQQTIIKKNTKKIKIFKISLFISIVLLLLFILVIVYGVFTTPDVMNEFFKLFGAFFVWLFLALIGGLGALIPVVMDIINRFRKTGKDEKK